MALDYSVVRVDTFTVDDGHVVDGSWRVYPPSVYPSFFVSSACGLTTCGTGHVALGLPGTRALSITAGFLVGDGHYVGGTGVQFGSVHPVFLRAAGGVGSAQSFGVPAIVKGKVTAAVGSVASAQAFGTVTPKPKFIRTVGSVASAQSFGTLSFRLYRPAGSVPSAQQFGVPTPKATVTRTLTGLGSAQAFGTVTATSLAGPQTVTVQGLSPAGGVSYAQEVLADAPALYWRLNESSGVAVDASGHGRDGTVVGPLQRGVPSPIGDGTAVRATATGQRVTVSTFPAAEATPFSYEFWWKPNAAGLGTYNSPVLKTTSDAWSDGFGCYWMNPNHALFFWVGNYTRTTWLEPPAPGPWPDWNHFAFTYDGNTQRAYFNGVYVPNGSNVIGAFSVATSAGLTVAGSATGTYEAPGDYDEFAFYDHVLTPARIAAHYGAASAVAGAPQFGTPVATAAIPAVPAGGVSSAQAFGTPSAKAVFRLALSGLGSAQAFGAFVVKGAITRTVTGLGSAQSFGSIKTAFTRQAGGVPSAQQFGVPTTRLAFAVGSVDTAQAFGTLIAKTAQTVRVPGVFGSLAYVAAIVDTFLVDDGHVVGGETDVSFFGQVTAYVVYAHPSACIDSPAPAICGVLCGLTVCGGESFLSLNSCLGGGAIVNEFICGQQAIGVGRSFLDAGYATSVVDQFLVDDGHVVDGQTDACLDSPLPALCDPATICGTVLCGGASFISEIDRLLSPEALVISTFLCGQRLVGGKPFNAPITVTRTIDLVPAGCL